MGVDKVQGGPNTEQNNRNDNWTRRMPTWATTHRKWVSGGRKKRPTKE